MADSGFKLTKEQYESIILSFENNDRTRAYMDLHSYTGFSTAQDMSKISHFSGIVGGIAEKANEYAAKWGQSYHPGGVEKFSEDVAKSISDYIVERYSAGLEIDDDGLLNAAKEAWVKLNIGNLFPGNLFIAWRAILRLDLDKAGPLFTWGTLFE